MSPHRGSQSIKGFKSKRLGSNIWIGERVRYPYAQDKCPIMMLVHDVAQLYLEYAQDKCPIMMVVHDRARILGV